MRRQNPRPIPVDKADIRETVDAIVTNVVRELRRRHPQDEPLGDLAPRFFVWSGEIDNPDLLTVTGQTVGPIDIVVTSQIGYGPSLILGGGVGRNRTTGRRSLVITLNGRYTVDALMKSMPFQKDELFSLLIHEFTHLKDKKTGGDSDGYRKDMKGKGIELPLLGDDIDESTYYNDPAEVRAHMQEIVEEALALAPSVRTLFDPNKTVLIALRNSNSWREVSPHLTTKNKNLILKAVYTALQDAGLLSVRGFNIPQPNPREGSAYVDLDDAEVDDDEITGIVLDFFYNGSDNIDGSKFVQELTRRLKGVLGVKAADVAANIVAGHHALKGDFKKFQADEAWAEKQVLSWMKQKSESHRDGRTLKGARRNPREWRRGDVMKIGKTQWILQRAEPGASSFWAYKWPSKKNKGYAILCFDDRCTVHEIGGSAQRISDDVASGLPVFVEHLEEGSW